MGVVVVRRRGSGFFPIIAVFKERFSIPVRPLALRATAQLGLYSVPSSAGPARMQHMLPDGAGSRDSGLQINRMVSFVRRHDFEARRHAPQACSIANILESKRNTSVLLSRVTRLSRHNMHRPCVLAHVLAETRMPYLHVKDQNHLAGVRRIRIS